ncbi:hypothetical protein KR222_000512, partial [Zaprionus bogoriensis]
SNDGLNRKLSKTNNVHTNNARKLPLEKSHKPLNYGTNNTLELLQNITSDMVERNFDEVLTAVKTVDNLCDYSGCRTKTSLMGQDCELCKKRYCFKHGLPEVHGCGADKKRQDRKEFLNPKPMKSIRQEEDLKKAKKKLNEKLKNMQISRMQKNVGDKQKK